MDDFGIVERPLATQAIRFPSAVPLLESSSSPERSITPPSLQLSLADVNAKQIEGVIPAMSFRLPGAEYAEINEFLKANP
jgi:hypothetical protein